MSAQFFLRYAGAGLRINAGIPEIVSDDQADRYVSEADAWLAAHRAGLDLRRCSVVNLYDANRVGVTRFTS